MGDDDPRRARLAAALRANLRRRKAPRPGDAGEDPPPRLPPPSGGDGGAPGAG